MPEEENIETFDVKTIEEVKSCPRLSRVRFTCTRCGNPTEARSIQVLKTGRLMCTKCSTLTAKEEYQALRKSMSPEELLMSKSEMHITDIHEIDNVPRKRYITFNCTSCGALSGNEACRLREKGLLLCSDCMKKHTNNERFGVDYVGQSLEVREKNRQYNIEHKDEINAARAAAVERKYGPGITNVMQVQEHKDACFESNRNNHGGVLAQQTDEQRQLQSERMIAHPEIQIKSIETNIANHGGVHSLALPENREKLYEYQRTHKEESNQIRNETNAAIFGKSDWMQYGTPEFNATQFIRFIDNYPNALSSKRVQEVLIANNLPVDNTEDLKRDLFSMRELINWNDMNAVKNIVMYNCTHPCSKPIYYDGKEFDSRWELAYYLYERDVNNSVIEREPIGIKYKSSDNKTHTYTPDFSVNGQLVEIKGGQFYKDKDPNNDLHCPYVDDEDKSQDVYKSIGDTIKRENITVISTNEIQKYLTYMSNNYDFNWLQSLYLNSLVRYAFSKFNFKPIYCNDMNNGKGVTPFDCDQTQSYSPVSGQGVTPFDILTK